MEDSEEHLFDRSELAGERREERNREDIEGELYGPRSEDASDSEGSLRDFLAREDEEDEAEADGPLMYAAFARERSLSPQSVLTRIRARRSRRIVSDDEEEEEEGIDEDERRRSAEEAEQRRPAEEAEQRMSEERQRQPDDHSPPPDLMDVTEGDPEDPLERLEHKWGIARGLSPMAFLQLACSNLDALDDFDPMMIEAASRACWADFATCVQWYSVAFAQGREVALSQDEVMKRLEVVKGVMRQAKEGLLKLVPRNSWQEGGREEVSARTELLSASYDRASLIGLRALEAEGCEQLCYSEIKSNGYRTRAFKVETTIQQALFDTCDCLGNELLYNKLTSVGSFQTDIPAHIAANRRDPRFPLIQKDRHVFAFQNGLYVAWLRKSILKNDCGLTVADGEVSDLFIPYEGNQVEKLLRPEVCACKYFDMPFDYAAHGQEIDWYQLATPNLQQILDAQRLPEEACKWVYVLIGRMLYSVGELDNLHLIVYLKGVAGTGKSLILEKVLKEFYETEDVGILSNVGKELFGLSAIYDKNLFYCSEVNSKFNLEQAKFQQMVSGESVSVAIKYKTAIAQPFKPHGFLAGNETFRLKDVSGSLTRRIVPVHFLYPVLHKDPELSKKVKMEVPAILMKANLAYHWALKQLNRDGQQIDFWSLKIPYFMETSRQFASALDPLRAFLNDPGNGLILDRGNLNLYCPLDVLPEKVRSGVGGPTTAELAQSGIWAEFGLLLFIRTGGNAIDPPYPRHTNLRLTKRCWVFCADILGDDESEQPPTEGLPSKLYEVVAAEYAERFP